MLGREGPRKGVWSCELKRKPSISGRIFDYTRQTSPLQYYPYSVNSYCEQYAFFFGHEFALLYLLLFFFFIIIIQMIVSNVLKITKSSVNSVGFTIVSSIVVQRNNNNNYHNTVRILGPLVAFSVIRSQSHTVSRRNR